MTAGAHINHKNQSVMYHRRYGKKQGRTQMQYSGDSSEAGRLFIESQKQ